MPKHVIFVYIFLLIHVQLIYNFTKTNRLLRGLFLFWFMRRIEKQSAGNHIVSKTVTLAFVLNS